MRGRTEKRVPKQSESDSEIPVCDVCGQNHNTESCIFISARPCTVEDAVTPTRARLTLPANLAVKDLADGSTSVVTKTKFARGTRFGPFIAPLTSILPPEVNFPLKIFGDSEEESFYLDTRNEDDCNWMCLVGSVSCNDTQNLLCYQVHDKIFFSLLHDIEPGEELRVWYAPFYGIKMGVSPGRLATNSSSAASETLEMTEESTKIEEPVTWEADTTTADILPDEARTAYVAQQLPAKQLGARFTPACWRCRECGAKEESVISYARHLMQHLKPRSKKPAFLVNDRKYSCSICKRKFLSQGLLDKHKATQHHLSNLMKPAPLEELGETSAELDDPLPMEECPKEESLPRATESLNVLQKANSSYAKDEKIPESESFLTVPCVQQTIEPHPRGATFIGENTSLPENTGMNCGPVTTRHETPEDIRMSRPLNTGIMPMKSSVTFQENVEKLEENSRKLVAVMGENALQNLLIPIDQQKDIDLLLQSFQQPTREKPVTHPAKVPETILNHEFFTRVAGDTVVRDVKSLLSMGYSLQFLVENEDGSSSLVDVLSTGNRVTPDAATSGASQNGEVTSQQLVIMANGNVPDSLPQALQGILPPSVPIVPSVVDPIVTPQSPLLTDPSADSVRHDSTAVNDVQLSCLNSEDSFLNKGNSTSDARSPLGTLLPSVITNNMCYDNVGPYNDSNSENASLMEMSLSGENLEREELDYELGALELPLAVDDTNSTDYMINACTSSPRSDSVRCTNLCVASNPDLNTPVKMLDQCIEGTLSSDVMAFDFEASSHVSRANMLRSPRLEDKNNECREELTKDFSDLIAADAESSNVMLSIQPADSTAELRKDDSVCSVELKNDHEKGKSTLEWMGSEGLLLPVQHDSVNNVPQTLVLNAREQQSEEIGFQPITGADKDTSLLKDNCEETNLLRVTTSDINAELKGLLIDANSNSQNAVSTVEDLQRNLEPHLHLQSKEQMQTSSELHLQLHQTQEPESQFHQQAHTQVLSQAESQHWLSTHTKTSPHVVCAHTPYQSDKQSEVATQVLMNTDSEVQGQIELQIRVQTITDIQTPHQPVSDGQQDIHSSPDLAAAADTEIEVEQTFISSGPPYICDICNKSFEKMDYLYRHLRKHTGEFTCIACCAVFARKETLQQHDCPAQPVRSKGNNVLLCCPFCQKKFPEKRQLTRHLVNHTGSRRYQCTTCGSNFASKEVADQHIQNCSSESSSANDQPSQLLSSLDVQEIANAKSVPKVRNSIQTLRCGTCRHMFSSEAALQRHEMAEHQDSAKDCEHCGRALALATPAHVALHTRICAPAAALQAGNADTAVCPECNEPFRQLLLYRQHVYRHTHPISCAHCHRSFRTLQARGKHVCLDLLEQCSQCGHRFGTVPQLERHALTHGVPHYHCYECGRSFHLMTDFKHHRCFELSLKVLRRASKKDDTSVTSVVSSSSLKRNTNPSQRSESDEVLMCEICGEVCKSRWALKAHHLLHGERKIECGVCGKRFHRKDVLVEHMYIHEEAQLRCTICNKLVKSKKSLDAHIRQQHCNHKQFICPQCGKEFHQKVNLQRHMKSHEKSRQKRQAVTCTLCGQNFQCPEDLAKHMAEHADNPGFQCTHCDRTFIKERSLSQHMILHRPRSHASRGFSCPACGHTLKHRNSLRRHIIKNHPELIYGRKVISEDRVDPTTNNVPQSQSPEVLLTVSQLQLTTDGVQQVSLPEEVSVGDSSVENTCLLEEAAMECSEEMVLYVLQEPLSCLPLQEPSSRLQ